ncbi:putative methyltransferase DDB_G0268948 isoform X2 [Gadus morhua]|uniref:Putative methyltransferase DDB_G0268948 n=1 Tax=Gadus morhua TaxID=8049 RepID=A0A8C4Z2R9_GADMO|nr:putative methyltransferase DDB_G0268948 isoform X2 [Gadus morhua]XP_056436033.1 putative methyltransferase DDB_G0268948 [Gadus chalcogrammus]
MAHRLFEGKEHAEAYLRFRVSPSDHLIQQVVDFVEKKKGRPFDLALDVGCGSGQGSTLLAKHFASVVATDISPAQIEMAVAHASMPNVTYKLSTAEELPLAAGSVDLVTAMSAFHWFDRPRFLQEAHRVLKPHGCLALLNYTLDMELSHEGCPSDTLNAICEEFYAALRPHFSPHLRTTSKPLYKESYEAIPYPHKEWHDERVRRTVPLSGFIGMVETFSNYRALLKKDPKTARRLSSITTHKLMTAMKVTSPETEVVVNLKYFYVLACKPAED